MEGEKKVVKEKEEVEEVDEGVEDDGEKCLSSGELQREEQVEDEKGGKREDDQFSVEGNEDEKVKVEVTNKKEEEEAVEA